MKTSEKIIDYLKVKEQTSGRELSDYLGISDRAVRKHLAKLLKDDILDKIGAPPKVFYFIKGRKNINKDKKERHLNNKQMGKLKKLFQDDGVVFAYLFGSRVNQNIVKDSDFDIAVYLSDSILQDSFFTIRMGLIKKISQILETDKLDLVILNQVKSSFFKFVVIKEGKLIFDSDYSFRIDFELETIQKYQDYKPIIEIYKERMIKEIKLK